MATIDGPAGGTIYSVMDGPGGPLVSTKDGPGGPLIGGTVHSMTGPMAKLLVCLKLP